MSKLIQAFLTWPCFPYFSNTSSKINRFWELERLACKVKLPVGERGTGGCLYSKVNMAGLYQVLHVKQNLATNLTSMAVSWTFSNFNFHEELILHKVIVATKPCFLFMHGFAMLSQKSTWAKPLWAFLLNMF